MCVQDGQRLHCPEGQHTGQCYLATQIRMRWQDWHYSESILHLIVKRTVQISPESHANTLYGVKSPYLPEDLGKNILPKWREGQPFWDKGESSLKSIELLPLTTTEVPKAFSTFVLLILTCRAFSFAGSSCLNSNSLSVYLTSLASVDLQSGCSEGWLPPKIQRAMSQPQ